MKKARLAVARINKTATKPKGSQQKKLPIGSRKAVIMDKKRVRKISTMAEMQAALQAAFNAINKDFYGGELEKVIITVKEGKKKAAFGWIETAKNWKQNGVDRHEINISADYIGERTIVQTITTLMHEMAHLYNLQNGIKDTTRSGLYHNKKFKETAEAHGLQVELVDNIGWSLTTATAQTKQWIADNIPIKSFGVYKIAKEKDPKGSGSSKQSSRKYVCPKCGLIARLTKEAAIMCVDCKEIMVFES